MCALLFYEWVSLSHKVSELEEPKRKIIAQSLCLTHKEEKLKR